MAREEGIGVVIYVAFSFYFVYIHVLYVNDTYVCIHAEARRQPLASLLRSFPPSFEIGSLNGTFSLAKLTAHGSPGIYVAHDPSTEIPSAHCHA